MACCTSSPPSLAERFTASGTRVGSPGRETDDAHPQPRWISSDATSDVANQLHSCEQWRSSQYGGCHASGHLPLGPVWRAQSPQGEPRPEPQQQVKGASSQKGLEATAGEDSGEGNDLHARGKGLNVMQEAECRTLGDSLSMCPPPPLLAQPGPSPILPSSQPSSLKHPQGSLEKRAQAFPDREEAFVTARPQQDAAQLCWHGCIGAGRLRRVGPPEPYRVFGPV